MSLTDLTNQENTMKSIIKDAKKEMKSKIKKLKEKDEDTMIEDAKLNCYDNSGIVNDDAECERNKELACVMKGKVIHKGNCVNIEKLKGEFIDPQVCNKSYLEVRDGKVLKSKPEFAVECHF